MLTSILGVGAATTTVAGRVPGTASGRLTLDFYATGQCDPSGFGEGQLFVKSVQLRVADGETPFAVDLPVSPFLNITATATDLTGGTSSFSNCVRARAVQNGSASTSLACGDLLSGSIDALGEVDLFSFTGATGDLVDLTLVETSNWGGSTGQVDARATVLSPTFVQVAQFDSNGQTLLELQETGSYVVRINANDLVGVGSYNLGFACLSFADPQGCVAPQQLVLENITTFDPRVFEACDSIQVGPNFEVANNGITLRAGNGIEFFNQVSVRTGATLEAIIDPSLIGTPGHPLGCGDLLPRSIDTPGEVDLVNFSGTAGQVIDLTLVETSNWGGSTGQVDARATVFSPTGVQVAQFDSNSQQHITLTETGTYVVRVNANNLVGVGSYNLGLACVLPSSPPPVSPACGDLTPGSIDLPGEVDLLSFTGAAGQVVDLTLVETSNWGGSTGQVDARATVFSPTGVQVAQFDSNSQQHITLTETGTYVVRVNANNLVGAGSYNLSLTCVLPSTNLHTPLACGDLLGDSIDTPGEVALFRFSGTAGQVIDLTLVETSNWGGSTGQVDARATVFSPTGVQVAQFDSNSQQHITLTETGTYVVRVNANNLVGLGSFTLGLACVLPPSPSHTALACGDLLAGSIDSPAEVDLLSFSRTAGDVIDLTLTENLQLGRIDRTGRRQSHCVIPHRCAGRSVRLERPAPARADRNGNVCDSNQRQQPRGGRHVQPGADLFLVCPAPASRYSRELPIQARQTLAGKCSLRHPTAMMTSTRKEPDP